LILLDTKKTGAKCQPPEMYSIPVIRIIAGSYLVTDEWASTLCPRSLGQKSIDYPLNVTG